MPGIPIPLLQAALDFYVATGEEVAAEYLRQLIRREQERGRQERLLKGTKELGGWEPVIRWLRERGSEEPIGGREPSPAGSDVARRQLEENWRAVLLVDRTYEEIQERAPSLPAGSKEAADRLTAAWEPVLAALRERDVEEPILEVDRSPAGDEQARRALEARWEPVVAASHEAHLVDDLVELERELPGNRQARVELQRRWSAVL